MTKWRKIVYNLFLCMLIAFGKIGLAQTDKLNRATMLYQTKKPENMDLAKLAIDSVIKHPETSKDFMSWSTRAFIYFELYKRSDRSALNNSLRDTIVSSLKTSNALKPTPDFVDNNKKLLNNLSINYFKIAKSLLEDSLSDSRSETAYLRSRELTKIARPDSNLKAADVDYYNAVGSVFSDIFNKDNNNQKAQESAKVAMLKVLGLQPDNERAHFNLGIMYYNQAANLGKTLDFGADISQIDVIQENIIKLAKQAEQQINAVYVKNNKHKGAIEALYYIYKMLNDPAKTEFFKKKCTESGITVAE